MICGGENMDEEARNVKIGIAMHMARNIIIDCVVKLETMVTEVLDSDDDDDDEAGFLTTHLVSHAITMLSCVAKSMDHPREFSKMMEISKIMVNEIILKDPNLELPDNIRENLEKCKISEAHIKMFEDVMPNCSSSILPKEVTELLITKPIKDPKRRNT